MVKVQANEYKSNENIAILRYCVEEAYKMFFFAIFYELIADTELYIAFQMLEFEIRFGNSSNMITSLVYTKKRLMQVLPALMQKKYESEIARVKKMSERPEKDAAWTTLLKINKKLRNLMQWEEKASHTQQAPHNNLAANTPAQHTQLTTSGSRLSPSGSGQHPQQQSLEHRASSAPASSAPASSLAFFSENANEIQRLRKTGMTEAEVDELMQFINNVRKGTISTDKPDEIVEFIRYSTWKNADSAYIRDMAYEQLYKMIMENKIDLAKLDKAIQTVKMDIYDRALREYTQVRNNIRTNWELEQIQDMIKKSKEEYQEKQQILAMNNDKLSTIIYNVVKKNNINKEKFEKKKKPFRDYPVDPL